jgi:hypothetical protein
MDAHSAETWLMGLCYLLEKPLSWGVPQLIIAVCVILAARRYRLAGMWILSAAAILAFVSRVGFTLAIQCGDGRPSAGLALLLVSYPTIVISIITVVGWAMLAFCRSKKSSPDA